MCLSAKDETLQYPTEGRGYKVMAHYALDEPGTYRTLFRKHKKNTSKLPLNEWIGHSPSSKEDYYRGKIVIEERWDYKHNKYECSTYPRGFHFFPDKESAVDYANYMQSISSNGNLYTVHEVEYKGAHTSGYMGFWKYDDEGISTYLPMKFHTIVATDIFIHDEEEK